MKCARVDWVDSCFSHGWCSKDSSLEDKPALCNTVGVINNETKEFITMVLSISKEEVADRITIPKCSVKKIKRFEV